MTPLHGIRLRRRALQALAGAAALPAWAPAALFMPTPAAAQAPSPHAIDIPRWFSETFLDFREDAAEAGREGKRLMLYFGQDGCPYCRELMQTNFSQRSIVDKTRKHFVAVALNIWGDRETTWTDGQRRSEKELARRLGVQFTPTLLFLGPDGAVQHRLDGYQPPARFEAVLDYLIEGRQQREPLGEYLRRSVKEEGRDKLGSQPFFLREPLDLKRRRGGKPLAVIFETRRCKACDEMHDQAFARTGLRALLGRFDVARLGLGDPGRLAAPDGRQVDAPAWARELKVEFTPSVVFFADDGREAFRVEGYTRPFHFESAFDYVASGAFRREPQFQRFVQERAERQRAAGRPIDLWR